MLPYYRLLPVEGFTIYPQVTLVSNDSPPKHSSSKGFHIVLPLPPSPHSPPPPPSNVFHWFSSFAISLFHCCNFSPLWAELFSNNVQWFFILNVAGNCWWRHSVTLLDAPAQIVFQQHSSRYVSDWSDSDCIILTNESILDYFDFPLSTILLVSFYRYHVIDIHFHRLVVITKIMLLSGSYPLFMKLSFASLNLRTYLCCFFQLSLTCSSSGESSGNLISFPRIT